MGAAEYVAAIPRKGSCFLCWKKENEDEEKGWVPRHSHNAAIGWIASETRTVPKKLWLPTEPALWIAASKIVVILRQAQDDRKESGA